MDSSTDSAEAKTSDPVKLGQFLERVGQVCVCVCMCVCVYVFVCVCVCVCVCVHVFLCVCILFMLDNA